MRVREHLGRIIPPTDLLTCAPSSSFYLFCLPPLLRRNVVSGRRLPSREHRYMYTHAQCDESAASVVSWEKGEESAGARSYYSFFFFLALRHQNVKCIVAGGASGGPDPRFPTDFCLYYIIRSQWNTSKRRRFILPFFFPSSFRPLASPSALAAASPREKKRKSCTCDCSLQSSLFPLLSASLFCLPLYRRGAPWKRLCVACLFAYALPLQWIRQNVKLEWFDSGSSCWKCLKYNWKIVEMKNI